MERKYIRPEIGQTYTLRNGGEYRCLWVSNVDQVEHGGCSALLIRDKDGWKFTAHGLQQNPNGTVEWDYSTGGHWSYEQQFGKAEVWKDCELGQSYFVRSFETKEKAEEWIIEHEHDFVGWHLRVEEKCA